MMATLHKYLFDVDFGSPHRPSHDAYGALGLSVGEQVATEGAIEMPPPVEEPPPPPTFSEEELALAREQAFAEGHAAGLQQGEAATERLAAEAELAVGTALVEIAERQRADNEQRLHDSVAVALAVVRKLLPELALHCGLGEIEAVIQACLAQLEKDVRVTVRLHPDQVEELRQRGDRISEAVAFEGKLLFTPDARIALGDCRVEWGGGGAERDQARIQAEIDAIIARALEPHPGNPADREAIPA